MFQRSHFRPERCLPSDAEEEPNGESTEEHFQKVGTRTRPADSRPATGSVETENSRIGVCTNRRAHVEPGLSK